MRVQRNIFYLIIGILFIGLIGLLLLAIHSHATNSQEAATSQVPLSPSPSPKATAAFTPPNPMIFLPSKAITTFFSGSPSATQIAGFTAQIAKLPLSKSPVVIKDCDLDPAITVVKVGTTISLKNADASPHTITYNTQTFTLTSGQIQSLTNTTKTSTVDTLSCDNTKYVGVVFSKP